ncbi:MAG: (Fe-S)-binding protein [Pirellulales bacterium]|nr:(Fe-S)-binding protein [Pirellulales bacterium]
MDYARPIMWNVPHWAAITLYILIPIVIGLFLFGLIWRVRKWFIGQAEPGGGNLFRQLWQALKEALQPRQLVEFVRDAFFQGRLKRDPYSLLMHLAIFWGMVILFIGTALATIDQDFAYLLFNTQLLQGGFYLWFELALDVFGVALILGLGMAAYRRYLVRPKRLEPPPGPVSLWDKFPFLTFLFLIAVTGFVIEGLRIAEGFHVEKQIATADTAEAKGRVLDQVALREQFEMSPEQKDVQMKRITAEGKVFPAAAWAPAGYGIAKLLAPLPLGSLRTVHAVVWWVHGLLAFGLIVAIPYTKAFHLLASPLNLLLRKPGPVGRLPVVMESGVDSVRDYTWRQLLEVDACTWCGKCQEVCPGYNTGFPLSPRDFVLAVDGRLLRTPFKDDGETPSLHSPHPDPLPKGEGTISSAVLWSCCTCRACEEICPVGVEHPRLIIDMRRRLVDQGQIDEGVQDALMNFQRYGNSFGQSPRKRGDWLKGLDFQLKDVRREEAEYLWFLGDYAAYDQRARAVTQTIARVLHRAGQDLGVLLEKEQNAGNDVRRIGEEGLFGMLRDKNEKALEGAKFRKVLTTDPHTYNTLKNEYNGEGAIAGRPVVHYTELLDELLQRGTLRPARRLDVTITYHDPCYLGRFNGVYDAPRRVLTALGVRLVEMPRCRENSFCCGAGGGRIWMKDTPGIEERPAENRVKEALRLPGVRCLAVACPKDFVMFQDAVKTVGAEDRLRVADLGELVFEALEG